MTTNEFIVLYTCGALSTYRPMKDWRGKVIMVAACILWPIWWLVVIADKIMQYVKGK